MNNNILNLFLFNEKLKFSEIETNLKIRSNKLAYQIKELVKKGVLVKNNDFYSLSETSEYLIPYLSEKKSPIPVILIKIGEKNCFFLHKREKRPFQGKLSLPGGRILVGESLKQATERIMREKFGLNAKFSEINSISLEHVKKNGKVIHSFFLFLVSAETKDKIDLIDITKIKQDVISSDYFLLLQKQSKININTFFTKS